MRVERILDDREMPIDSYTRPVQKITEIKNHREPGLGSREARGEWSSDFRHKHWRIHKASSWGVVSSQVWYILANF